MISQTDTALVPQDDTSALLDHHKQHLNSKNSSTTHSQTSNSKKHNMNTGDNEISANILDEVTSMHADKGTTKKRRKLFDETIVDGFAIIAFKSWDDLQNELNERLEESINSDSNNNNINSTTTLDVGKGLKSVGNNTASDRSNKHSKHYCHNGTSSEHNHSSSTSDSKPTTQTKDSDGKKVKSKSSSRNVSGAHKEKRSKPSSSSSEAAPKTTTTPSEQSILASSTSTTLEQAIEAKELAERRLSILERKLEQEQTRNRHPASTDQYPREVVENNNQSRTKVEPSPNERINGFASRDTPQPPQSLYLFSHRQAKHPMRPPYPMQSPPTPPQSKPLNQVHDPNQAPYHLHSQTGIGQSNPMAYPYSQTIQQPNAYPVHNQPQQATPFHQTYPHLPRYPPQGVPTSNLPPTQSQSNTQPQHPPSHLTHPYQLPIYSNGPPAPSPGHLMSSMGLNSLPTPYAAPSICITDTTISRQTSIIPPMFDPVASRYGSSTNSIHPTSSYPQSALAPPHHPMYYPTLPAERSFFELARSYAGPSHFGYPSIMSAQNTSANMGTACLDRWPRTALDHQRAISRYNNLYQNTTIMPSRAPSNYPNVRPPFPAGLFPPQPPPY